MAKMFYSLEETAQKLGVTPSEVRDMVTQGRLQEFRDRDRLMFKVEQVELISGGSEAELGGSSMIPLADIGGSGSGLGLAKDDSGPAESPITESPKERSGISIFDSDQLEEADPSAVTQVTTGAGGAGDITVESVGSGSGLLDLTREADDTSLGADLLEGVAGGEGAPAETGGTSGLFETTGAASDVSSSAMAGAGMMMVAAEPFDGTWSGLSGGLALGVVAVAMVSIAVAILGLVGMHNSPLVEALTSNFPLVWIGGSAAIILVCGLIGWAIGRKS
ncbi:MAG: hypothetical protein KF745_08875 [Phycisphaeraceae bacterium]|nr:hypothetical protein [Phycisphaeraceae bacterium]